ncbi:MAG: cytosolic protein [Chloroflexi bacterium RBG_16_56_11]|nr:MAG: cytosolic protein [Chloroflexi bacterium RBG_16_56_11]
MEAINVSEVSQYIEGEFNKFLNRRINSVKRFKMNDVLFGKNPYFFSLQNKLLTGDFVKTIVDNYLNSQEETFLDSFLEHLAIFINQKVYNGWKSSTKGIDLEFNKDNIRYIVAIKSGPNWGNSSQIRKMQDDFRKAKQTIRTSNSKLNVIAVNGCCYGRNAKPDKGEYYKYCGQKFWEFISGSSDLYLKIIKPLGYSAKEKNDEFLKSYAQIINRFTQEFSKTFVKNGEIDWHALVKFNSGGIK